MRKIYSTLLVKSGRHIIKFFLNIKKNLNFYFDLIDLEALESKRICDLGCGIGRWSYFLKDIAKEIVLVDFF